MKIRTKLLVGFGLCATLVAIVAAISFRQIVIVASVLRDTSDFTVPEIRATNRAFDAAAALVEASDQAARAAFDGDAKARDAAQRRVEAAFASINTAIDALRAESGHQLATIEDPAGRDDELKHIKAVDDLEKRALSCRSAWSELSRTLDVAATEQTDRVAPSIRTRDESAALHAAVGHLVQGALGLQESAEYELVELLLGTLDSQASARKFVGAACFVGVALAIAVALGISRPIVRRLADAKAAAERLGRGDLSVRMAVASRPDEIDRVAAAFNDMAGKLGATREELIAAASAAREANRAKSAFLANMSHEIRTPMTAILGFADQLLEPDLDEVQRREAVLTVRRNANHLLELINDILDLAKIEAGKMDIGRVDFELAGFIRDIAELMRPRAIERGLAFRIVTDGRVPAMVRSDPLRLRQVLINLLGNAIKFTKKGSVTLTISAEMISDVPAESGATPRTLNRMTFSVADTGIGMTAAQREKLFQPFTQADDSMTRRFGGTGLGLSISRRLAELLGGGITVSSQAGIGSEFRVSVDAGPTDPSRMIDDVLAGAAPQRENPASLASAQRTSSNNTNLGKGAVPASAPPLQGRVLLAEDGIDNQRLISMILTNAGAVVTIADNGRVAVELLDSHEFDLVLMDMQMPEMDGYTATRLLRERGRRLPIIALTAHAMSEDRDRCLAAGCSDYLTKPIERERLIKALSGIIGRKPLPSAQRVAEELGGHIDAIRAAAAASDIDALTRTLAMARFAVAGQGGPSGIGELITAAERKLRSGDSAERVLSEVKELVGTIDSYVRRSSGKTDSGAGPTSSATDAAG